MYLIVIYCYSYTGTYLRCDVNTYYVPVHDAQVRSKQHKTHCTVVHSFL